MTDDRSNGRGEALSVATATAHTTALDFIRLACQAGALILSIHLLGAAAFGIVAATVAMALLIGPWSGLGCDFLALRTVARTKTKAPECCYSGLVTIGWSATILTVAAWFVSTVLDNSSFPVSTVVPVFVAELFF